jgi:hypothetical protein
MVMMRVRTTLNGGSGLPGLNTFYFNGSAPTPITADASDVCARVRAFWLAIVGLMPTGHVQLVNPAVDLVDSADGSLTGGLVATTPLSTTGTGGTVGPTSSEMLLSLETAAIVAGRRLRGHSFIGPHAITNVDNLGQLGATQRSTLQSAANAMITGSTTSFPVVWHRPGVGGGGGTNAAVTAFVARTKLAVLRSRRD